MACFNEMISDESVGNFECILNYCSIFLFVALGLELCASFTFLENDYMNLIHYINMCLSEFKSNTLKSSILDCQVHLLPSEQCMHDFLLIL